MQKKWCAEWPPAVAPVLPALIVAVAVRVAVAVLVAVAVATLRSYCFQSLSPLRLQINAFAND